MGCFAFAIKIGSIKECYLSMFQMYKYPFKNASHFLTKRNPRVLTGRDCESERSGDVLSTIGRERSSVSNKALEC